MLLRTGNIPGDLLKERLESVGRSGDPLEVFPVEHST